MGIHFLPRRARRSNRTTDRRFSRSHSTRLIPKVIMSTRILDATGPKALSDFIDFCDSVIPFNKQKALDLATQAYNYYSGSKSARNKKSPFQDIENRWYQSLLNGAPDYALYDDLYFVCDIWSCWILYSRKYILALSNPKTLPSGISITKHLGDVSCVADLGCGFGYTTAALKETFPRARVFGTNFPGSKQYAISTALGKKHGFEMKPNIAGVPHRVDLVFASEYFEHFQKPTEHLLEIIKTANPRAFFIANSFGSRSMGHFNEYLHGSQWVNNKSIGRLFNAVLREHGYEKVQTTLWNNRPSYWVKK